MRRLSLLLFLLHAWFFLSGSAFAGEVWPQFRGPRGDGCSDSKGLPKQFGETKHLKWKTPVHGRGWSSPVVWGEQVWVTTATTDGKELFGVCVDRASGKVVHDLKVFDVEKPEAIHDLNSYASPTPAVEAGRVFLHFGSYGTTCLDTATAKKLWERRDLPCNHFRGPGSSPVIVQGLLVVHFDGFDHQYVVALDKESGKTVWKTDRSNDYGTDDGDFKKAFSTPLVIDWGGRQLLVSAGSRAAMAYEPLTGKELWCVRFQSFSSTAMPVFGQGLVYINTGFGKADLVAVRPDGQGDVTDTHVVWTLKKGVPSKPSALLIDDLICMVHDGGVASAVDAKSGEVVWTQRLGGSFSASPVYAGGAVYFLSQEGKVTVIEPSREYKEVAVNQLDEGFMASPAVAGKALFLRTRTHLYRIEE
jgi:outer membrane protein assembly factor BamB